MKETSNHIISRFRWDTRFDQKQRASELQQRLSYWSRMNMHKEATDVFDKLCPPEQTWRIQSLELDLGVIDFNDLEFELSTKLIRQLNEKLIDLIIYARKAGDPNIEILDENNSPIDSIRSFLLHGLMPWNYKPADGSLDQILTYQLQHNRQEVIAMLREVGSTHEDVRKRMAWQIKELNIHRIIEGIEPNNHSQIIGFSDELTKIQSKENIVQVSSADFKKNLWHWIFNYLFTERGTVFNKTAFMKSSIRQMAHHYNIGYDELFELIEQAVAKVSESYNVKSDFVLTLQALSKENEALKKKTDEANVPVIDYWHRLELFFLDQSSQKTASQKSEFNELVISLSRQDKPRFRALLVDIGPSDNIWHNAVDDLNNASLETILSVLSPSRSTMLTESIHFIGKMSREMKLYIKSKLLWQIGIHFLYSHKDSAFDTRTFLEYCIVHLSKTNQPGPQTLEQFLRVKIPSSIKTISTLEIYTTLTSILVSKTVQRSSVFFADRFKELVDLLINQSGTVDKDLFDSLQNSLTRNIQFNPKAALQALMQYSDKESLRKLLPYLLNEHLVRLLIKHSPNEMISLFSTIQQVLKGQRANKKNDLLIDLVEEHLMNAGLQAVLFSRGLQPSTVLEFILKELSKFTPASHSQQFRLLIDRLLQDKKLQPFNISKTIANKIYESPDKTEKQPVLEQINFSIKQAGFTTKDGNKISFEELFTLIARCLEQGSETVIYKGIEFQLNELIDIGFESAPAECRRIMATTTVSHNKINILKASVPFSRFSSWIMNDDHSENKEVMEAIRSLHDLVEQLAPKQMSNEWTDELWMQSWLLIQNKEDAETILQKLVQDSFYKIAKETGINGEQIITVLKQQEIRLNSVLRNALVKYIPAISTLPETKMPDEKLLQLERKGLLDAFTHHLITQKQIPAWAGNSDQEDIKDLLNEIVAHYPMRILTVLKRELIAETQMHWLTGSLNFDKLTRSIVNLDKSQQTVLAILQKFYVSLGNISLGIISPKELQNLLCRKILKAWRGNNWKIISIENIWNELLWDICTQRGISQKDILRDIERVKSHFPPSLQVSLELLKTPDRMTGKTASAKPVKAILQKKDSSSVIKSGIAVRNAGLVLVNNYITVLFERLGIIQDKKFTDIANQCDAVHYLQYLATGLSQTEESLLVLNKVICGLPLSQPIKDGIDIPEGHQKLIEGLLQAIISHWPSIGNCSVAGFRGNWLVRDGWLTEQEDKWELTVEKRAYDLLINKSPFSFSIIKYPWMSKPLHVCWPY